MKSFNALILLTLALSACGDDGSGRSTTVTTDTTSGGTTGTTGPIGPAWELSTGHYLLYAKIDEPAALPLKLLTDLRVGEDGEVALAGIRMKEVIEVEPTTTALDELLVDATEDGLAFVAVGQISAEDSEFEIFTTAARNVAFKNNGIDVEFVGMALEVQLVGDDPQMIEGTVSFDKVLLVANGETTELAGNEAPLAIIRVDSGETPDGTPNVCDAPCGAAPEESCVTPEGFPPSSICPDQ